MVRATLAPCLVVLGLAVGCDKSPEPAREQGRAPAPTASAAPAASKTHEPTVEERKFVEDMNTFCVITQKVRKDPSVEDRMKAAAIARELVRSGPCTEFLVFMQDLADVPKDKQYEKLKLAAATRGAPHWSCPALADDTP